MLFILLDCETRRWVKQMSIRNQWIVKSDLVVNFNLISYLVFEFKWYFERFKSLPSQFSFWLWSENNLLWSQNPLCSSVLIGANRREEVSTFDVNQAQSEVSNLLLKLLKNEALSRIFSIFLINSFSIVFDLKRFLNQKLLWIK